MSRCSAACWTANRPAMSLPPDELIVPGFENELCMRLGSDLSGTVSLDDARAAIDVVYPSLEIIETRDRSPSRSRWHWLTTRNRRP